MNAPELQKLIDWLIDGGRSATSPSRFMAECCERMVAAGLPLWRVGIFVRTLHPDIYGRNFIWKPGSEVEVGSVDYKILESPDFHTSPLIIVFQQGLEVRARADDPQSARFPIVNQLRAEGVTDYIALPLFFTDGTIHASSWTTKQPGGFTDEQVAALHALITPLSRSSKSSTGAAWLRASWTPMSATAPAKNKAARSGAAHPYDERRVWLSDRAVSPRCQVCCRPRPWTSSITTSMPGRAIRGRRQY